MTTQRSRGFTLIELLVVIAIIAILVALLLPAVQQVREAARKSQCQDHLHNLAIATANYEGNSMMLPPGAFFSIVSQGVTTQRGSTLVHLLPYVEQKPLYDNLDFKNIPIVENSVFPGTTTQIRTNNPVAVFVCPSDTAGDMFGGFGAQNYISSQGSSTVGHTNTGNTAGTPPCVSPFSGTALGGAGERNGASGCFRRGLPAECTIGDILDGTSNVIWFGEARPECSGHVGNGWLHTNNGHGMGSTTIPINFDSCSSDNTTQCRWRGNWNTEFGFRSRHPGGAQFAFGDGVVRFLSENIDHKSYQRLGGKADGNPVKLP
jgi:prepilin-type N-terminal cleavage/methylation domain-containing protein/prepilin-type processing-associated H-X9-DG protein